MSTAWNLGFTQLLRNTQPSYWGNWSLDPHVTAGAVGIVTPTTGAFQYISMLPNADIKTTSASSHEWKVQSSDVNQTSTSVDLKGSVTDPETGVKVDAGLQTTWKFAKEGSLSSTFLLVNRSYLDVVPRQLLKNKGWLIEQAKSVGMCPNGKITQGFGVVTQALMTASGLNIGSQSTDSSFSITGTVEGTQAMSGAAPSGSAKGSYARTSATKSFEQHLWPANPNTVTKTLMPIAFQFASFVGDTPILGWVTNLSGFSILLDDSHGGTYIVKATATYDYEGKSRSTSASVSGGRTTMMNSIPVGATNLKLDLAFKGMFSDEKHHFNWPSPLGQFPNGQIVVDLYGVWPGSTRAVERNTGAIG